jgi:CheY-like chemotaxis protein
VVEDDLDLCDSIARLLVALGYETCQAENAVVALALLEAVQVDLVFTDIAMPGELDGIDLAALVRSRWPRIAVLLTSGNVGPTRQCKFATLLADVELLRKPCSMAELTDALERAFNREAPADRYCLSARF